MSNASVPTVIEEFADRLQSREDLELELKLAQGGLPASLWETVSAFANTNGGWIVLGINGEARSTDPVIGVPNPEKRLQEFLNEVRNPKKISHPVCGPEDAYIHELSGRRVIVIRVPAVARRHRPVYIGSNPYQGTYVRLHAGDYRCMKPEVDRMIRDASAESVDSTVLARFSLEDLDAASIARYRRRHQALRPDSAWTGFDDLDFLRAIGAYGRDRETGAESITVAGLLLLGKDQAIREWRGGRHIIDFQLVSPNQGKRWDDRIVWEGNLLGAVEEILPRLWKDLPKPFRLEDGARVEQSPVHVALREALINLLVHADYSEAGKSEIIRATASCRFRNPGRSLVPYRDLLAGHRSELRNPTLVRMFRHIGFAEEAGTGIAEILRAWKELGYTPPRIDVGTDRYEFTLELRFVHFFSEEDRNWLHAFNLPLTQSEQFALLHAKHEGYVDNESLRAMTSIHPADATKCLTRLREQGFLQQIGTGRGAKYELGGAVPLIAREDDQVLPATATTEDTLRTNSGATEPDSGHTVASSGHIPPNSGHIDDRSREMDLRAIAAPAHQTTRLAPSRFDAMIVDLCAIQPLSLTKISALIDRKEDYVRKRLRALMRNGRLRYLYPDRPNHPDQKYVSTDMEPSSH